MEQTVAVWAATVLTAKVFAGVIRREFGVAPEPVNMMRSGFSVDPAFLAILAVSILVVDRIGVDATLPVAILLRAGSLASTRILLTANHIFLELFTLVLFLRLGDRPDTLAAAIQLTVVSLWLYAAAQKLYHRQFADGSFFYVLFQDAGTNNRWARVRQRVARLDRYYAAVDPASQAFCRRLAWLALTTEVIPPLVAFSTTGTIWGFIALASVSGAVASVTRETNFLITNLVLAVFFLVPFDLTALRAITADKLAGGILGFLLVWPPVHAVLTRALRLSTWKLGGWGMYATIDPKVEMIDPNGGLVSPPMTGFWPYRLLQVCGGCKVPALREYARRRFVRWYPAKDTVRGFLFRRYEKRGSQYVSMCVVVPNVTGGTPVSFELSDEASVLAFKNHVASFRMPQPPNQPPPPQAGPVDALSPPLESAQSPAQPGSQPHATQARSESASSEYRSLSSDPSTNPSK